MKFTVDGQQRGFFREHRVIVFEKLLSDSQVEELNEVLGRYSEKRDLWRSDPKILAFLSIRSLAETASSLMEERPLRVGFDQLIPVGGGNFSSFLTGDASLNELSSYQGITCGVLLPIGPNPSGKGLFVHPRYQTVVKNWIEPEVPHYLITYTGLKSQYILNRRDPYASLMGRMGYNPGDRIRDETNPIVYR